MIIVTDGNQCIEPIKDRIAKFLMVKPRAIVLREKHLNESEYLTLASAIIPLCVKEQGQIYISHHIEIATALQCDSIHVSYKSLVDNLHKLKSFKNISVSIHSLKEAIHATELGATSLMTGHIFQTECKQDLSPRGLKFLSNICASTTLPVYAIGGINEENYLSVLDCGATDFCIMQSAMTCLDVEAFVGKFI